LVLLDEAETQTPIFAHDLESQRIIASDVHRPVEERLEAFEDIRESEVGDTSLSRSRNIERETGLRQLYLKFEGGNPTGTQKDRIAFAQVLDAIRRGYEGITVATCGNYGMAVATAASMAGLKCDIYIPEGYHTKRIDDMENLGASIFRVQGDYEHSVNVSREKAGLEDIYDANPGGANTDLQLRAYGEIAYEIYDELRDAPSVVSVPVSNGTTLVGIYKGFVSLYRRGKTSRIPRIVAGSSYGKNPIIRAFLENRSHCPDLAPIKIRQNAINEPLINWHSSDGENALEAIRTTGGWAAYASDKEMTFYSRLLRNKEGLHVLPASTAGLIVLVNQHRKQPFQGDRYVVVLTGRKA